MFLLALMAAVAFPSFMSGAGGGGIEAQARRAGSMLRSIDDTAMSYKKTIAITFDFAQHKATWKDPQGQEQAESFDLLTSVELPERGEVREGELIVFFSPLGMTQTLTMHFAKDDKQMRVTYNPITRRVKIIEGAADEK